LRRVAAGEQIEIRSGGRPVARLVPVDTPRQRQLGFDRGRFELPDDFDAPLPPDVIAGFA
jgi:antitoxin (DNA-binding transcriptional repressor) of toxin-antitoxin stability system